MSLRDAQSSAKTLINRKITTRRAAPWRLALALFTLACPYAGAQAGSAEGTSLAIIDSGVDNEHPELQPQIWKNPGEIIGNGRDDDRNAYIDDVFGWNFAENSPLIIDRSYLGSFSDVPYRFFALQEKLLRGSLSPEEREWLTDTLKNKDHQKELQTFANFVHGTHVAGIATRLAPSSSIVALKIIPTQIKPIFQKALRNLRLAERHTFTAPAKADLRDTAIRSLLFALAQAQGIMMSDVGRYLHRQKIKVANGSFGVSAKSAEAVLVPILRVMLTRNPTQDEVRSYSAIFVNNVVKAQSVLADSAKETLLVFAAGNDGTDNDSSPTSPANIKRDNTLSVAATDGIEHLAAFSNFGKTQVDIAAPGVAVRSTAPGAESLVLSGTSQAAPYVAGIAAEVRAINPELSPAETRKIVLGTAEKMAFLEGKVSTGGMVHRERALAAAEYSRSAPLQKAVESAFADLPTGVMPSQDSLMTEHQDSRLNIRDTASYVTTLPVLFE